MVPVQQFQEGKSSKHQRASTYSENNGLDPNLMIQIHSSNDSLPTNGNLSNGLFSTQQSHGGLVPLQDLNLIQGGFTAEQTGQTTHMLCSTNQQASCKPTSPIIELTSLAESPIAGNDSQRNRHDNGNMNIELPDGQLISRDLLINHSELMFDILNIANDGNSKKSNGQAVSSRGGIPRSGRGGGSSVEAIQENKQSFSLGDQNQARDGMKQVKDQYQSFIAKLKEE